MPTRAQVLELLDSGCSYEDAGATLRIPPGLAYMIATGRPADAGGPAQRGRPAAPESPQRLVNPRSQNPVRDERVLAWVHARAARELSQ